jgi:hypothetical protein
VRGLVDRRFALVALEREAAPGLAAAFRTAVDALPDAFEEVPATPAGVFVRGVAGRDAFAAALRVIADDASAGDEPFARDAGRAAEDALVATRARAGDVRAVPPDAVARLAEGAAAAVRALSPTLADWTSRLATSASASST